MLESSSTGKDHGGATRVESFVAINATVLSGFGFRMPLAVTRLLRTWLDFGQNPTAYVLKNL